MIGSVLGSHKDARIPSAGLAERPQPMLGYPGAGSTHNVVRASPPLTMTDENQGVVAHHAEKLQIARAAEKVGILVETKGNTLEAAVECASWRSAGLDRALKIDRSGKTSQFFAQSSHSRRAHYSKNRPKTTQKWPNFPCARLSDTWIPCAERRRSPENDARIP